MAAGPELSYVLPLRWPADQGIDELTDYLRWLARRAQVLVVDGSAPEAYAAHRAAWGGWLDHRPPRPDLRFLFGKVNGVITGVHAAAHDRVVIADDDVRYDETALDRMRALLDEADVVWPQNHFDPLPWHARWDTARTLLNRALARDYPGTLGVRRSAFVAAGAYDGDVLFENLELLRTLEAAGASVRAPLDLFVRRLPPSTRHFLSQRVRQAYDDFALPARMGLWLSLWPLAIALLARRRRLPLVGGAVASMAVAEVGRRRCGGWRIFPATSSLLAPAWLAERGICAWLALGSVLLRGGVPYGDVVIRRPATPRRELRRRAARRGARIPLAP